MRSPAQAGNFGGTAAIQLPSEYMTEVFLFDARESMRINKDITDRDGVKNVGFQYGKNI